MTDFEGEEENDCGLTQFEAEEEEKENQVYERGIAREKKELRKSIAEIEKEIALLEAKKASLENELWELEA